MRLRFMLSMICLFCLNSADLTASTQPKTKITSYRLIDADSISFYTGTSMGMLIPAGQSIEFAVPEKFRNRLPNFARIRHRKDRSFLAQNALEHDPDSPWLSVFFHNPQTDEWVAWQDQFGPEKRSALASPFYPKQNTLYNFPEYVGNFSPDCIRVFNRGEGDQTKAVASLHGLEIYYLNTERNCSSKRLFKEHTRLNSITIRYVLDNMRGLALKPAECFEFEFPDEFKQREILQVILKHRKDPALAADPENYDVFNPNAAYILCEAHSSLNNLWYKWADRSSIAKFSEVRPPENAENETLHNCLRTFGSIKADRFRLTNVGEGDPEKSTANIHELEIMFAPARTGNIVIEKIFTPETSFSDAGSSKPVPLIGGGPRLGGKFPGALLLGKNRATRRQQLEGLPEEHRFEVGTGEDVDGNLRVALPPGCHIELVETAIGDLDVTSLEYNKDGYFGRSGQAQASILLESAAGSKIPLKMNSNVGMAGIITCGGPAQDYLTREGDQLLIEISNDEAFLMGYRLILSRY
ncbi:MAG: hypothetical protein GQF41_1328 [Candidatus Rifleibacterium amylolyticum]|nr:MAG: hypothetical protein GQF41_1328 [Candidatus Rifleibacterium amylolyticum]